MAIPPLDLSQWLDRHDDLPIPPDAPHESHSHWCGESVVCYGLSRPLAETSFIAAVRQAIAALWDDVRKQLGSIDVARECNVALPAIRLQNSPEGYRLRAQTMIMWLAPSPPLPSPELASDFEISIGAEPL